METISGTTVNDNTHNNLIFLAAPLNKMGIFSNFQLGICRSWQNTNNALSRKISRFVVSDLGNATLNFIFYEVLMSSKNFTQIKVKCHHYDRAVTVCIFLLILHKHSHVASAHIGRTLNASPALSS